MSLISSFVEWVGTAKGELATAGLVGSAVSAALEWAGWRSALRKIIVGVGTATYLGPTLASLFDSYLTDIHIPPDQALPVAGFVIGVTGVVFVEILLKLLRLKTTKASERV